MIDMFEGVLCCLKMVFVLMIVLFVVGVFSYINIFKEDSLDIDVLIFYVFIMQQGILLEDVEWFLIWLMEIELCGLDGFKEIMVIVLESYVGIILEFDILFDKDEVMVDVCDKVDIVKGELLVDVEELMILEINFVFVLIIIIVLFGNVLECMLYQYVCCLKDQIEVVDFVCLVDLKGYCEEVLEVLIDFQKLEFYEIMQQELLILLFQNNQLVLVGYIDGGQGWFNVKVLGLVEMVLDVYFLLIK